MERSIPEIVIGFVAPSGTDYDRVKRHVSERLRHYGYGAEAVKLSDILEARAIKAKRLRKQDAKDYAKRTKALQAEGDLFREQVGKNYALALAAVIEIVRARKRLNDAAGVLDDAGESPKGQVAYLVWSFKTPEELRTLRAIYGSRFFAVSVHNPRDQRLEMLAQRIAKSRNRMGNPSGDDRADAEKIVANDEHEDPSGGAGYGQNVRDAYPLADFFVGADDQEAAERVVDIIFGHPFLTPTRDEFGMFVANAAAMGSAELGRQVGAAIANERGEILAMGLNEVPAAGGGQYSADCEPDHREFRREMDSSEEMRGLLAGDIEQKLRDAGLLKDAENGTDAIQAALRGTQIRYLTEFGRALHAEASAFLDAARRGVPVVGGTLYVTTFPCHQCTRQVIAAGVKRVAYIYPYPKSLAARLHGDAIFIDEDGPATKVPFESFRGVAPRRYLQAFTMPVRKTDDGRAVPADDPLRSPRLFERSEDEIWDVNAYIVAERNALLIAGDIFKTPV